MKDKILEITKGTYEKMGWKLWALVAFGILGFIIGIPDGIEKALEGIITLPLAVVIIYYMYLFLFKAFKKTAKVAGKTAVAAGKGAVFITAAGIAASKGHGTSSAIKEGNRAEPSKANNNSNEPKKTVRKVWRCTYIGTHSAAPKVLDVPSENATGRPTGYEFVDALKAMGYDDALAHSIASGGSNSDWECE